MALYDHRAFQHQQNWWVAQVYGQGGMGWGPGPHPTTSEFVLFTCLTDEGAKSRRVNVPVGKLNAMSHASVVRFLRAADPLPSRIEMTPFNTPDESEYQGLERITDEEHLRWVVRKQHVRAPALGMSAPDAFLQVICLDDSALRRDVLLQYSTTFDDFQRYVGDEAGRQLVLSVKGSFEELWPEEHASRSTDLQDRGA